MADYSSWEIAMADCSSWEITMLNTPLSLWVNSTIYVQNTLKAKSSTLKTKFAGQINFTLFGWIQTGAKQKMSLLYLLQGNKKIPLNDALLVQVLWSYNF